jgi:hypothetical protein
VFVILLTPLYERTLVQLYQTRYQQHIARRLSAVLPQDQASERGDSAR